jgi:hypothetical protein
LHFGVGIIRRSPAALDWLRRLRRRLRLRCRVFRQVSRDRLQQDVGRERLMQRTDDVGALLLVRRQVGAKAGHIDDARIRRAFVARQAADEFIAFHVRQNVIEQDQIRRRGAGGGEAFLRGRGAGHVVVCLREDVFDEAQQHQAVIDDEDPAARGLRRRCCGSARRGRVFVDLSDGLHQQDLPIEIDGPRARAAAGDFGNRAAFPVHDFVKCCNALLVRCARMHHLALLEINARLAPFRTGKFQR